MEARTMNTVKLKQLPVGSVSRRTFLGVTGMVLAAACAPSAAPPQATAPATTAAAGWEGEWNELVAAAKKEGQINLILSPGYGNWAGQAFKEDFPEIEVQWSQFSGSAADMKKLLDERSVGIYDRDAGTYNI